MIQLQSQSMSPVGCLFLTLLLALLIPVLIVLAAIFLVYYVLCRVLGVQPRRPKLGPRFQWANVGGRARRGGTPPPEPEAPFTGRGAPSRPASEDVIDVVAVEVTAETDAPNKRLGR